MHSVILHVIFFHDPGYTEEAEDTVLTDALPAKRVQPAHSDFTFATYKHLFSISIKEFFLSYF